VRQKGKTVNVIDHYMGKSVGQWQVSRTRLKFLHHFCHWFKWCCWCFWCVTNINLYIKSSINVYKKAKDWNKGNDRTEIDCIWNIN